MAFLKKRNYATLVAPLKKMASDLASYISEQTENIKKSNNEKVRIQEEVQRKLDTLDSEISISEMEIKKSAHTSIKISEMLAFDLDDNGVVDTDELPPDDPPATGDQ